MFRLEAVGAGNAAAAAVKNFSFLSNASLGRNLTLLLRSFLRASLLSCLFSRLRACCVRACLLSCLFSGLRAWSWAGGRRVRGILLLVPPRESSGLFACVLACVRACFLACFLACVRDRGREGWGSAGSYFFRPAQGAQWSFSEIFNEISNKIFNASFTNISMRSPTRFSKQIFQWQFYKYVRWDLQWEF